MVLGKVSPNGIEMCFPMSIDLFKKIKKNSIELCVYVFCKFFFFFVSSVGLGLVLTWKAPRFFRQVEPQGDSPRNISIKFYTLSLKLYLLSCIQNSSRDLILLSIQFHLVPVIVPLHHFFFLSLSLVKIFFKTKKKNITFFVNWFFMIILSLQKFRLKSCVFIFIPKMNFHL